MKEIGCTLQQKEDLHPKREGKKKIESKKKKRQIECAQDN